MENQLNEGEDFDARTFIAMSAEVNSSTPTSDSDVLTVVWSRKRLKEVLKSWIDAFPQITQVHPGIVKSVTQISLFVLARSLSDFQSSNLVDYDIDSTFRPYIRKISMISAIALLIQYLSLYLQSNIISNNFCGHTSFRISTHPSHVHFI